MMHANAKQLAAQHKIEIDDYKMQFESEVKAKLSKNVEVKNDFDYEMATYSPKTNTPKVEKDDNPSSVSDFNEQILAVEEMSIGCQTDELPPLRMQIKTQSGHVLQKLI